MALTDVTDGSRVIQQGMMPYKITLNDTCKQGDLIGYDADDGVWEKADAADKVYADFVAGETCKASGDVITVFRQAIVTGFSDGVVGNPVYLGDTAGEYEDIPDTVHYQQVVGVCLSDTEVLVEPRAAVGVFGINRQALGWGGYIRSEIQDETTSALWGGLRIDCKAVGGTLSNDVFGLFVFLQLAVAPGGSSALLRLEDGCGTLGHPDAFITFISGAVGPDYLFDLGSDPSPSGGSFDLDNTPTTGGGNIKVKTSRGARYLALYTANTGGS